MYNSVVANALGPLRQGLHPLVHARLCGSTGAPAARRPNDWDHRDRFSQRSDVFLPLRDAARTVCRPQFQRTQRASGLRPSRRSLPRGLHGPDRELDRYHALARTSATSATSTLSQRAERAAIYSSLRHGQCEAAPGTSLHSADGVACTSCSAGSEPFTNRTGCQACSAVGDAYVSATGDPCVQCSAGSQPSADLTASPGAQHACCPRHRRRLGVVIHGGLRVIPKGLDGRALPPDAGWGWNTPRGLKHPRALNPKP